MMRLRELFELQEAFERVFREARAWREAPPAGPAFEPPTDVSRDAEAYHIRTDLPGVTRDQVRVTAEPGAVTISGRREAPLEASGRPLRRERKYGHFTRVVALPSDADLGQVTAKLQDGVLHVRVGRVQPPGPVRIEVEIAD